MFKRLKKWALAFIHPDFYTPEIRRCVRECSLPGCGYCDWKRKHDITRPVPKPTFTPSATVTGIRVVDDDVYHNGLGLLYNPNMRISEPVDIPPRTERTPKHFRTIRVP